MSDLPIVDADSIANLRDLNPGDNGEFLREIITIYLEDTPKRIAEMKEALASGDASTFTRSAHTIKGSSSNVGALALRGVAEQLEKAGKSGGLAGLSAQIEECDRQFALAAAELRKLC